MIQPGSTLGDFELLDELGRGGMGVVYRARQVSLGREVAVKVLPAETVRQGNVAERFEAEARSMARLSHPAIASVYLVGEEEGSPFFAMQLLPGGTLEDRIRSGALSPEQAVSLAVRVAEGLDHAHSSGVIHRDIKPANILFDAQGQPVVTDFGIAKAADNVKLTATGMAVGTPQYMAPEQAKGNPSDHRADIYALGCVLYEMVCGRPPFSGETPVSIAVKHISEPPPPPRSFRADVPDWLESIILKALAKEPSDRFSTAADMARALNAKTLVGPVPAPVPTTAVPVGGGTIVLPPPGPPRTNWLPAIIGLLALLGAGVIAGVALRPHEPPAGPPGVADRPDSRRPGGDVASDLSAPGSAAGQEATGPDGGTYVWVPPGEFMMGSEDGDEDEKPVHRVRITKGYWLSKCEVTNAQYRAFCEATGREFPSDSVQGDEHPVVYVSWEDAQAYCAHFGLRLPTEAEWEYAARGPESRKYPWGDEWDRSKCCNAGNRGPGGRTFPVGSFPSGVSWCGALDLAGNVWEWCQDWQEVDYYKNSPSLDPKGATGGEYKLVRGGSFFGDSDYCRAAGRGSLVPGYRYLNDGFRPSRTP